MYCCLASLLRLMSVYFYFESATGWVAGEKIGFLTKSWEHSELFMQQYLSKCFTPNLPSLRCGTVYLMISSFRAERGDPGRGHQEKIMGSVQVGLCGPRCLCGATDQTHAGGSCCTNDISHRSCFRVIYCWVASGSLVELLGRALGFVLWKQKPFLSKV